MAALGRAQARWLLAVVVAVAFGVHFPALDNLFAFDDRFVARSRFDSGEVNPGIAGERSPLHYFTWSYWGSNRDLTETTDPLYRPVTILSYALVYRLFGQGGDEADEAWPQHLLNLLLHALATWLVYLVLRRVAATRVAALLGAVVFAVHALHSEAVASVVGRAEMLSLVFGAAGILCAQRTHAVRNVAAALALLLAFCSKETAVGWAPFLLVVVLARIVVRDPGVSLTAALGTAVPRTLWIALPPLVIYFVLRSIALGDLQSGQALPMINPLVDLGLGARLATAVMIWGYGLWKCVWPFDPRSEYGAPFFELADGFTDGRVLAALVALAAVLVVGLRSLRRAPLLFCGMAAFLGFSFISSNVPRVIGTIFGDRLYYLPSLGVCFAVAGIATMPPRRPWRHLLAAALAAWCAASAIVSWQRSAVWRDNRTLFRVDGAREDAPARARVEYAKLVAEDDPERYEQLLESVVAAYPPMPEAWGLLGRLAAQAGDHELAIERYRRALDNGNVTARDHVTVNWALFLSAVTLGELGLASEALTAAARVDARRVRELLASQFNRSPLRVDLDWLLGLIRRAGAEGDAAAWQSLTGLVAFQLGALEVAARELEAARDAMQPGADRLTAILRLARVYWRQRRIDEAKAELNEILADPSASDRAKARARRLIREIGR